MKKITNTTLKMTTATLVMVAGYAFAAPPAFDISTTGQGEAKFAAFTVHSVPFSSENPTKPLVLTPDNTATGTALSQKGGAHRVISSTTFTPEAGHTYELSTITYSGAVTSGLSVNFAASAKYSAANVKASASAGYTDTTYIILTQDADAVVAPGTSAATYTISDFYS